MTPVFWIAIGLAAVVFVIFAGWPLYATYKTRGQGADVVPLENRIPALTWVFSVLGGSLVFVDVCHER